MLSVWGSLSLLAQGVGAVAPVEPLRPLHENYPALYPGGESLAFVSDVDGDEEIYLMDLGTGATRQLTDNDVEDGSPNFSPDGKYLVLHRQVTDTSRDLFRIEVATGRETRLTNTPHSEQHPRYSPDGEWIVFDGTHPERGVPSGEDDDYAIFLMPAEGGAARIVADRPGQDLYPSLHPDGRRIVWRGAEPGAEEQDSPEIFVKDLETGEVASPSPSAASDTTPTWSPRGDWLVFASNRDDETYDLYALCLENGHLERLTKMPPGMGIYRPNFAFDAQSLVAARVIRGRADPVRLPFELGECPAGD